MKRLLCSFVLTAGLCAQSALAADITMVGIDKDGLPVEVTMPAGKYQNQLKKAIVAVEASTLPVLQKKSAGSSGWLLRTVVVGLGVNTEIGLGEVKFGILPRFRIGFSNAKEPAVP